MKITKPTISHQNNKIIYSVKIEMMKETRELWYSISDEFEELISDSSDAALVALLIPAMSKGEDIYIDGPISEKLFYNISYRLQKLIKLTIPSLNIINIYPTKLQENQDNGSGVASGFSGGIDSFFTLDDHYYNDVPNSYKLTHLTYFNTGSHGAGVQGEELFQKRYSKLKSVVKHIGLPFIKIDSNLDSFYTARKLSYVHTHSVRNASVAILLKKGIKHYMYSSGYSYSEVYVKEGSLGWCDPITLPLLSIEKLDIFSVGSEYSRVEKTIRVGEVFESYNTLDVCFHNVDKNVKNCSKCLKCLLTLTTMEIAGLIERYTDSFDLEEYVKHKNKYLGYILSSNKPLEREIVEFAKKENFSFPYIAYIYMIFYKIKYYRKFLSRQLRRYISKKL